MSEPTILISGAGGFVGQHLVRAAATAGYAVRGLYRKPAGLGSKAITCMTWNLGEAPPLEATAKVDYAVHLAHDFGGAQGAERTVRGTLSLAEALERAGTSRQLFVSSLSAQPYARSLYGKTKWRIEQHISHMPNVSILRPGLVIGDGGLYGRIAQAARWMPVIPLPAGGKGLVHVTSIGDLCNTILLLSTKQPPMPVTMCHEPYPRTLRSLIEQAASAHNRTPLIIPVPSTVCRIGLFVARTLGIPLPVSEDNLVGFLANQANTQKSLGAPSE